VRPQHRAPHAGDPGMERASSELAGSPERTFNTAEDPGSQ
jgi:hypothetical protein